MHESNFNINTFDAEIFVVGDPAAGAGFSHVVANRTIIQLVGLKFSILTAAGGGDRTAFITFTIAAAVRMQVSATQNIPAATLRHLNFFIGIGNSVQDASGEGIYACLPEHLYLPPASTINVVIRAIQAGDQITNISLCTNRWIQH